MLPRPVGYRRHWETQDALRVEKLESCNSGKKSFSDPISYGPTTVITSLILILKQSNEAPKSPNNKKKI